MNKFLFILSLISPFLCLAQPARFRNISTKDGLISNTVNDIFQDSDGFMWLGTPSGLDRYDGYDFLHFGYDHTDTASLSNNHIKCLTEDHSKNLWIGTENGISVLDMSTYKIRRLKAVLRDGKGLGAVSSLQVGENGSIWVGTETCGLFNINGDSISHFESSDSHYSLIGNEVQCLLLDPERGLLVGTKQGLDLLDLRSMNFRHILANEHIRKLSHYSDTTIFIGVPTVENHYYLLSKGMDIERKRFFTKHLTNRGTDFRIELHVDRNKNEWYSIRNEGVLYRDRNNNKEYWLEYDKYRKNGLGSNSILNFFEDRLGNIWIGSFDGGVDIFEKHATPFFHVGDNFRLNGLRSNLVRSMFQDSQGNIWIGTKINGTLSRFNREDLTFTHYENDIRDSSSISSDFIFSIAEEGPEHLWLGTANGLNLFNKHTGKAKIVRLDKTVSFNNKVYALCKIEHQLFAGSVSMGVYIYDTENKTTARLSHSEQDKGSLSDDRVRVLYKDSKDNLWVGTVKGLNLYNRQDSSFQKFLHDPELNSISDNRINCMHEDKFGQLWIGTNAGINRFSPEEKTFTVYTTEHGLPSNSVHGILEDDIGNLWISTNNGLSRFNPKTKIFRNYSVLDGLQANEFSPYVYLKTKSGEMLFGGNNGFNIFHPERIVDDPTIPKVILTDFKLFNRTVPINDTGSPLQKYIGHTQEVTLNYQQSVLSINYVALNSISPQKSEYAYFLEGFDSDWNFVGPKREATYTNLDHGNYRFKVKATNSDGIWSNEEASIIINVLPPPWKTWWAYLIYSFIVSSVLYMVRYFTLKRIKREKEHELDLQKLSFFTNVSHELLTPLTLIINPLKKIMGSDDIEFIHKHAKSLDQSAQKLFALVKQLLDFRRTNLGKAVFTPLRSDITRFSHGIFQRFEELAKGKNISTQFDGSLDPLIVDFDPNMYETILNNLFSNAVKYTDSGGSINLQINIFNPSDINHLNSILTPKLNEKYVEIKILDSGRGIAKQHISTIFDKFKRVDNTNTGTGIGLNHAKNLVEEHSGTISVESTFGSGSTFIIRLPIRQDATDTDQIIDLEDYMYNQSFLASLSYDLERADNSYIVDQEPIRNDLPIMLIVEDNKVLRGQLRQHFQNKYIIKEAANGKNGFSKAKKFIPDVILSDVIMPVMDGTKLCNKLKSDPDVSHIPVILLTAKTFVQDQIQGLKVGADDYITKPVDFQLLEARVLNLIESRKSLKASLSDSNLLTSIKEIASTNLEEAFLEEVTNIVLDNIHRFDFSVQDLRVQLKLSPTSLFQRIKTITGDNPSNFIRSVKLRYAGELLEKQRHSVKEVCYLSGFSSQSYFTKCFKIFFGKTPTQYIDHLNEGR